MNRDQRRVQDTVNRLLAVMTLAEIAQKAGLTTSEVQAARDGQATESAIEALDNLGDDMDGRYAQNR